MKTLIIAAITNFFSLSLMAQTPISLKLNIEKNKVNKLKITSQQSIEMTANGQPFNMENTTNTCVSYKVLSQEKDIMQIEFKFDTIQSKINSPMFKKETNSAIPSKSKDPLELLMNKLSTYKLIAKISTAGKFIGFVNYKTFKDSVMMEMDSVSNSKKDEMQKVATGLLMESSLQSMVEPFFAYLPEKPVNIGEKWETTYNQKAAQASLMTFNTFTLNKIENNLAKISGTSEIESMPMKDESSQFSLDAKGSSTFEMTIDLTTGLISKNSVKGHIEGTSTVNNQGNEMKMPMKIEIKSEIFNL